MPGTVIVVAMLVLMLAIASGFLYAGFVLFREDEALLGFVLLTIAAAFVAIVLMALLGVTGVVQIPAI